MFTKLQYIILLLFGKVDFDMSVVYVSLIIKGKRTFSSIPNALKEEVRQMLYDLELDYLIDEE